VRSLDALSYRHLSRRRGRYGLVFAGVAIGVAVVFGVLASSSADTAAVDAAAHGSAGSADAVITTLGTYDARLPAGVLARVEALPHVVAATPSFGFRTAVEPKATQLLHGASFTDFVAVSGTGPQDRQFHDYALVSGRMYRPGVNEVVIPASYARRLGVGVGGTIPLVTPLGVRPVTVTGLLADSGPALSNGGSVAYTSMAAAQALDGRPGDITSVEVKLTPDTSRTAWIPQARRALGDSVSVINASDLASDFKGFLAAINGAFLLASAIAVFVGGFLVFLTFSVSVAERTRVWGTLRALGAVPRQVRRLVVAEAVVLGFAASLAGLVFGCVLAAGSVRLVDHLLYLRPTGLGLPFKDAFISVILAVVVSALAAWLPGRRAAALSPVVAMRDGPPPDGTRVRWWPGLTLLVVGFVVAAARPPQLIGAVAAIMTLAGAVLLVPPLLRPMARFFGSTIRRLAPGTGDIAVMHLVKERSRSSYTLALVMIVLAMIIAVGASNQSLNRSLDQVIDRQAGSGLAIQVSAAQAFDPAVGKALAALPGVRQVTAMEFGRAEIVRPRGTTSVPLQVIEPQSFFAVSGYVWVNGSDAVARAALATGGSILLPDTTAQNLGVKVGQPVSIRTTQGVRPFTLAATYASVGTGYGAVAGTPDLALLGAGRPNVYGVRVGSTADVKPVEARILSELGPRYQPFLSTGASAAAQAHSQVRGFYSIGYVLLGLAGVIGMLGLANTLIVSVLSRTREIGILRSTGLLRRQVRRMVLVEAEILALVASALALPLGAMLAAGIIAGQRSGMGFSVNYQYPWGMLVPVIAVCLALAGLASLLPGRRAARLEPVAALRFD